MRPFFISLPLLALLYFPSFGDAECNVCHSRRPEMRAMHEALGYKDCFTCHGPTARAMDRATRSSDLRCVVCHKN